MSRIESQHKIQTLSIKLIKIRNWEYSCGDNQYGGCEEFGLSLGLYGVVDDDERVLNKCKGRFQASRVLDQFEWDVTTASETGVISIQLHEEHLELTRKGKTFLRLSIVHNPLSNLIDEIRSEVDDEASLHLEESENFLGTFDLQLSEDVLSSNCERCLSARQGYDSDIYIILSVAMEPISSNFVQIDSSFIPQDENFTKRERVFVFSVDLIYCKALNQIFADEKEEFIWVSCEYLGNVVQSEKMIPSSLFTGQIEGNIFSTSFLFQSSYGNSTNGLRKGGIGRVLNIYICAKDSILGHACTSIEWKDFQKDLSHKKHVLKGFVHFNPFLHGCDASTQKEAISPLLQPDKPALQILLSFCLSTNIYNCKSMPFQTRDIIIDSTYEREQNRTNVLESNEKMYRSFEIIREKWNHFRHNEEMKFHKHLREKEAALRSYLEKQKRINDRDKEAAIEKSCAEYQKLKSRLKTALLEIEAKERQLERSVREKESAMAEKMTKLGLEQKQIKEDSSRRADAEVSSSSHSGRIFFRRIVTLIRTVPLGCKI